MASIYHSPAEKENMGDYGKTNPRAIPINAAPGSRRLFSGAAGR